MGDGSEIREWTFEQLTAENGIIFLHLSFAIFLKREMDDNGRDYYWNRLSSGCTKSEIISQIIRSPEARLYGVNIPGLNKAMLVFRLSKVPIFGSFIRYFLDSESHNANSRQLRAIQAHLSDLQLRRPDMSIRGNARIPAGLWRSPASQPVQLAEISSEEAAMYAYLKLAE